MTCSGRRAVLGLVWLVTACEQVPADPDGTLDSIRRSGRLQVGIVTGTAGSALDTSAPDLARATGARATIHEGEGEELLYLLDQGELDVVFGSFADSSPWHDKIWLSSPLLDGSAAADRPVLRAGVRAGENGWIMAVEAWAKAQ